jgi:hypothetical protein
LLPITAIISAKLYETAQQGGCGVGCHFLATKNSSTKFEIFLYKQKTTYGILPATITIDGYSCEIAQQGGMWGGV